MKPRLTYTKGMASSNPFQRSAEKLYLLRKVDPCGFFWPDKFESDHIHRCMKHRTHGITHKCNCGASISRKKSDPKRHEPVHDVECCLGKDCTCTPKEEP